VPRARGRLAVVVAVLISGAACSSGRPAPVVTFSVVPNPTVTIGPASCSSIPLRAAPATAGLPDDALSCLGGGGAVSLARLKGPALVNVWGSWCGPCVGELPVLGRFAAANPSVTVVGVDVGDKKSAPAITELSVARVRYPNLVDFPGEIRAAGAPTVPTTFFIDSSGNIAFRHIGPFTSVAAVRADVLKYLGVRPG
jgi:cytochrome c biogenesis protein CcmG/thiol:disulfide interchange protein DsbE